MDAILEVKQSDYAGRVPVRIFELAGEMDASTSDQFQKQIQQAVEAGVCYVLLDFSRLRYISSAGVRALYLLAKMLSARGGAGPEQNTKAGSFKSPYLKLFNPSPAVRQTLDLMGFTMSLEIHNDLEQILASF